MDPKFQHYPLNLYKADATWPEKQVYNKSRFTYKYGIGHQNQQSRIINSYYQPKISKLYTIKQKRN